MIDTFKKPDVTAPRFRQSSIGVLNDKFYRAFYKKYPEYKGKSKEDIKAIVHCFNELLWKTVIEYRDGIELPEGLGYMFLGSCAINPKENPDYKNSARIGKRVMNRNLASDGYLAKIFYTNYDFKYRFKHRKLWKFKGGRDFTRTVSATYKEDWNKYIVVEDYVKISNLFRKRKSTALGQELRAQPIPEDYNEFDLD